ncbi:SdpI family protein [Brevibacillus agri]|uniref:SdpI family protein n=1 Tax=Brevibacillus agri TaxID=51101 RepID=UPI001EE5A4C7|nr:SdpI family protein [Brevibacillus agri]MCG5253320.1 SdpI family protein [Brevibacillus agri]MED4568834.1 SdpI family protein [Brevibacillus agri]WHX28401.1 SdpI family protein [Brevibacillus agri]
MKISRLTILCFLASVVMAVICYPSMPDTMAVHWGINGEPDGFAPKLVGVAFVPIMMVVLFLASRYREQSYQKFASSKDAIMHTLMVALLVIHGLIIGYGYGYMVNMATAATLILGVLFITMGNFMPRFRHNYMIGIRTPWTLASEEVWKKTHQLGSRVFFIGGLLIVLTSFLPAPLHFIVLLFLIVATILVTMGSSYYYAKRRK